jgi:hypothetical protein
MIAKPFSLCGILRLAAAAIPLWGIVAAPVRAESAHAIAICSSGEAQVVYLPEDGGPPAPRKDRDGGCSHFTCPRDRNGNEPGDDEED